MSLINEVLVRLEQSGAHKIPKYTSVRAVPMKQERQWVKPVVLGVILVPLVAFSLWRLFSPKKLDTAQMLVAQQVAPASAVASASSVLELTPEASALPASRLSYELSAAPEYVVVQEKLKPAPVKQKRLVESTPSLQETAEEEAGMSEVQPPPARSKVAAVRSSSETKLSASTYPSDNTPVIKQVSRTQQADAEYRKAVVLQQQGHVLEAVAGYESALKLNVQHDEARQALAAALLLNNRGAYAERVLQEGLKLKPLQTDFSMALARMQVVRGDVAHALETLQKNLAQADNKPEYQAFYAALLQREGRHKEAVTHYQIAVQQAPRNGIWLMGYGISLQVVERMADAKVAYQQALATQTLSPELTAFVQQKLKGL